MKKKIFYFSKWLTEDIIDAHIDHHIEDIEEEDIKKFDKKKSFIFSKWRTKLQQEEVLKK